MFAQLTSLARISILAALVAQIVVLEPALGRPELGAAEGPIKTGGGNGARARNGAVTPLDVVFATRVQRNVDLKKAYPGGHRYFQKQIEKLRQALPTFTKDFEAEFNGLTWNFADLGLNDQATCRNNTGIYKLRQGETQVVIACQDSTGVVTVDVAQARAIPKGELIGAVMLHEGFVRFLLKRVSQEAYAELEQTLITEVIPYILSHDKLDPATLVAHVTSLHFSYPAEITAYYADFSPDVRQRLEWFHAANEKMRNMKIEREKKEKQYGELASALLTCSNQDARVNTQEALEKTLLDATTAYIAASNLSGDLVIEYKRMEMIELNPDALDALVLKRRNEEDTFSALESSFIALFQRTQNECIKR